MANEFVTRTGLIVSGSTYLPAATSASKGYILSFDTSTKEVYYMSTSSVTVTVPGSDTQVIYNNGGSFGASSNFVFSGSNVGIGTASPNQKLVVSGNASVTGVIYSDVLATYGGTSIDFRNQSAESIMYLDASNKRVGIGTTSPTSKLFVAGTTGNIITVSGSDSGDGIFLDERLFIAFGDTGTTTNRFRGISGGFVFQDNAYSTFGQIGSSNTYFTSNVGIGTTSPSSLLHVSGTTPTVTIEGSSTNSAKIDLVGPYTTWTLENQYINGATNDMFRIYNSQLGANAITINRLSNNVGIGTTNPSQKLEVSGSGYIIKASATGSDSSYFQAVNGSYDYIAGVATSLGYGLMGMNSNHALAIMTSGSERMRISSAGNVGIGTTSPAYKLEVNGTGRFSGELTVVPSATNGITVSRAGGYASLYGSNDLVFETDSVFYFGVYTPRLFSVNGNFYVSSGGLTSIGKSSANATLDVSGSVLISGSLTVSGSSTFTNIGPAVFTGSITQNASTASFGGLVGIGTTTPSHKLQVVGPGTFASSTTNVDGNVGLYMSIGGSSSNYNGILFQGTSVSDMYFGRAAGAGVDDLIIYGAGELVRFKQNGNVGIGTSTPSNKLQVAGGITATSFTGSFSGSISAPGSTTQIVYNSGGALAADSGLVYSGSRVGISTSTPVSRLQVGAKVIDDASYSYDTNTLIAIHQTPTSTSTLNDPKQVLMIARQGTGGEAYGAAATFDLSRYENSGVNSRTRLDFNLANGSFLTQNTRVMTMLSNGNVGIGTTSPSYTLDVAGDINTSTGVYRIGGSTILSGTTNVVVGSSGATGTVSLNNTSGAGLVLNGANVGIGTSSPATKLNVVGGRTYLETGNEIYTLGISRSGANAYYLGVSNASSPDLYFSNNAGTTRVTFTDGGNVGIDTSSPASKLQIGSVGSTGYSVSNGLAFGDGTRAGALNVDSSGTTLYSSTNLIFSPGTTEAVRITSAGNVGIGTTTPSSSLHVVGTITAATTVDSGRINLGTQDTNQIGLYRDNTYDLVLVQDASSGNTLYLAGAGDVRVSIDSNNNNTNSKFIVGNNEIKSTNELFSVDESGSGYFSGSLTVQGTITAQKLNVQQITSSVVYSSGSNIFGNDISNTQTFTGSVLITGSEILNGKLYLGTTSPSTANSLQLSYNTTSGDGVVSSYSSGGSTTLALQTSDAGSPATRLYINSSGNVGIGTTSPVYPLHVDSSLQQFRISGNTNHLNMYSWADGVNVWSSENLYFGRDAATANKIFFQNGSASTTTMYVNTATEVVAVGTTTAFTTGGTAKLSILGSSVMLTMGAGASDLMYFRQSGAGEYQIQTNNGTNGGNIQLEPYGGNVGIGTTSPSYKLHVDANTDSLIKVSNGTETYIKSTFYGYSSGYDVIQIGDVYGKGNNGVSVALGIDPSIIAGGAFSGYEIALPDLTEFITANGPSGSATDWNQAVLVITGSRIGIGTGTPTQTLEVGGNILASKLGVGGAINTSYDLYNNGTTYLNGETTVDDNLYISGNVGIGTTNPTAKLEVNGNIKATSFTGSFSGSISSPGSNTQVIYNSGGALAGASGLTYDGAQVSITTSNTGLASSPFIINQPSGDTRSVSAMIGTPTFYNSGSATNTVTGSVAGIKFNWYDDNWMLSATRSGNSVIEGFVVSRNGSEKLVIGANGNVGIGTTEPQKKLEVITAASDFASVGVNTLSIGEWTGIQFGYREANSLYRKSAIVFERTGGAAQGKIHFLNNIAANNSSATLSDSKMVISDNGNVGIGTTSPTSKLTVYDTTQNTTTYSASLSVQNFGGVDDNNRTQIAGLFHSRVSPSANVYGFGVQGIGEKPGSYGHGVVGVQGIGKISGVNNSTGTLYAIGVEGLVYATASNDTYYRANTTYGLRSTLIATPGSTIATHYGLYVAEGNRQGGSVITSSYAIVTEAGAGNVGIGTTSPSEKLHVVGGIIRIDSNTGGFYQYNTSGVFRSAFYDDGTVTSIYGDGDGSNPAITISSGNVGIGTTSPSAPLTFGKAVYGDPSSEDFYRIKFEDVGGVYNDIGIGQPTAGSLGFNVAASGYISFNEGTNGERVRIAAGGNVGIGTTSPSYRLQVSGSIAIENQGTTTIESTTFSGSLTGNTNIAFVPTASFKAAFFDYYVASGSVNMRAGTVMAVHNNSTSRYTDTSTADIGTTAAVDFSTSIVAGSLVLTANISSGTWEVKTAYRAL